MKKHKTGRTLCSFLLIGMFIITGCRKKEEPFVYNNHIFTKELLSEVIEIRYGIVVSEEEDIIIDEKRIRKICRNLASLKLTEVPENEPVLYGSGELTLITKEGEFSVDLLGWEISVPGKNGERYKRYSTDKCTMKYFYDDDEEECE